MANSKIKKTGYDPAEENQTTDKSRGADGVKRGSTVTKNPIPPVKGETVLKPSAGTPYSGETNNVMSGSQGRELRDRGNI